MLGLAGYCSMHSTTHSCQHQPKLGHLRLIGHRHACRSRVAVSEALIEALSGCEPGGYQHVGASTVPVMDARLSVMEPPSMAGLLIKGLIPVR
jgi:hypothetical protein